MNLVSTLGDEIANEADVSPNLCFYDNRIYRVISNFLGCRGILKFFFALKSPRSLLHVGMHGICRIFSEVPTDVL